MEVRSSRIEGAVQIFEVVLTVNMASLTIEQVIGKRRKVVRDMCDQLKEAVQREAKAKEWQLLRREGDCSTIWAAKAAAEQLATRGAVVPPAVNAFLTERIMSLAREKTDHYNQNDLLGAAIREAVRAASDSSKSRWTSLVPPPNATCLPTPLPPPQRETEKRLSC